ncbi:MAG: hypothetical protein WC705_00395 [Candidatus Paceibacterota bacterium]|jgi:hypothetical protein
MQLRRTITVATGETLDELLSQVQPGDSIVLYEGPWDSFWWHTEGVIIRLGRRLLLNGKTLIYEGNFNEWRSHPEGVIVRIGEKFLINGTKEFQGGWGEWRRMTFCPKGGGVSDHISNKFRLTFYQ